MARKVGVSKSEMLRMREEGLSNKDIAACLGIHVSTVFNYIGKQGCRMESLSAFNPPKPKEENHPKPETKSAPKATDNLRSVYEVIASTDGAFRAEVDWENGCVSLFDTTFSFEQLEGLAIFTVCLASKIERSVKN